MMKKTLILLLLGIVLSNFSIEAAPISSKEAIKIANDFMFSHKKVFPHGYLCDVIDLEQVFVVNYILGEKEIGFVVVAGDNALPSKVLAFSGQGKIKMENKSISALLKDYSREIKEWQEGKIKPATDEKTYYQRTKSVCTPLLKDILWNQSAPYNLSLPLDGQGKRSLVGCTPIAMGQIMKYYQYPTQGLGESSYIRTNKGKIFSAVVDYDSLSIDWNNIKDKYDSKEPVSEAKEVANFLYFCALSAEANFSSESTGAGIQSATIALFKHFGYHPSIRNILRKELSDTELQQLIYKELEAQRPVLCSGYRHSFVCDGYIDDFFHFNWGWAGRMNGYFKLSALTTGDNIIRMFDNIVVNIRPQSSMKELHKEVNLPQPGTLQKQLSDKETETLTSLTVTGKLNGKDFLLLRKMAGGTSSIWENGGELRILDLSKAEIVSDTLTAYATENTRLRKWTQVISGKNTPNHQPMTFRFETMDDKQWETLCALKGDKDYKNGEWKYIKEGNDYYIQFYTADNKITSLLFESCKNLKKLVLPEQTREIVKSAFRGCSLLEAMEIPAQVTDIHARAWEGCLSIKTITAHPANPKYSDKDGVLYSKDFTVLVYYPSYRTSFNYAMPQTVTHLRSYAFDEALFLRNIELSGQIKKIPEYAFYICPSLTSIQLPESVTEILSRAFFRCKSLSKVYLPSRVEKIGNEVFNQCVNLTEIVSKSTTPPVANMQTFNGLTDKEKIKLSVPQGTAGSYKSTVWKFFNNISEL